MEKAEARSLWIDAERRVLRLEHLLEDDQRSLGTLKELNALITKEETSTSRELDNLRALQDYALSGGIFNTEEIKEMVSEARGKTAVAIEAGIRGGSRRVFQG